MGFKHTGIFPEQAVNWDFAINKIKSAKRPVKILNMFAYTGAATLACLSAGASVCHVDASKGMVQWAKENAVKAVLRISLFVGLLMTALSLYSVSKGVEISMTA